MTKFDLIFFIVQTALALLRDFLPDSKEGKLDVPESLLRIAQAASQAHREVTGQPIDMSKVEAWEPIEDAEEQV